MARAKSKAPARRHHISGNSVVTLNGRDFYLGVHDSPESIARYAVLISIYQDHGLQLPAGFDPASIDAQAAILLGRASPQAVQSNQADLPITVRHVTAAYREHIRTRYAETPAEIHRLTSVCDEIDRHDGDIPATDYGPLRLQAQRQRWIESGKARVYCNRLTRCVCRIFKYAVSQELVSSSCWERLRSVESLRQGQTTAHEKDPIGPVDIDHVRVTAEHLSPVVRAMIRVQIATGMRPSEVCRMRPTEIDRSGEVWVYRPAKHKTAGRGKIKAVPILGDAREAITDYLNRDPQAYCFSPRESMAWTLAKRAAARVTPLDHGNRPGKRSGAVKAKGGKPRSPGECYDHGSYRRAVTRAAKAAKVPVWNPYRLRHLAATTIREALGIEAAQAALGHSHADMTQHYAKQTLAKAIEAAKAAPKL